MGGRVHGGGKLTADEQMGGKVESIHYGYMV